MAWTDQIGRIYIKTWTVDLLVWRSGLHRHMEMLDWRRETILTSGQGQKSCLCQVLPFVLTGVPGTASQAIKLAASELGPDVGEGMGAELTEKLGSRPTASWFL